MLKVLVMASADEPNHELQTDFIKKTQNLSIQSVVNDLDFFTNTHIIGAYFANTWEFGPHLARSSGVAYS